MPLRATGLHADELPVVMGGRHILGPPVVGGRRQCSRSRTYRRLGQIHQGLGPLLVLDEAGTRWCWRNPWWSRRRPGQIHRVLQQRRRLPEIQIQIQIQRERDRTEEKQSDVGITSKQQEKWSFLPYQG
jgi:hypothetical protein